MLRPSAAALPVGTLLQELVFGAENPAQQQGNVRAEGSKTGKNG